ncbi:MAG: NAD(P)/FAD-dependent oxidoreductase, partial [Gemmatimonadota bacterium]
PTRVAYPRGVTSTPGTVLIRLFDEVDGYFWDFSRPDHRSVGTGVEPGKWNRRRLDAEIDLYLAGDRGTLEGEAFSSRTGAVIGTAALGHGSYEGVGGPDFALLGDAAGFADPATGEGIQNALLSAGHLAECYDPETGFVSYPAAVRAHMDPAFRASRVLRRVLFQLGVGDWLLDRGKTRRWARALVSAVMNSTNEHDLTALGLARRARSALSSGAVRAP